MTNVDKDHYAPLPMRAITDRRMKGAHFRVLAAICAHDRLSVSRRGQGCWASNRTLAAECGVNYTNLSTTIRDLGIWNYVRSEPHPLNKRTRVLRINYTAEDKTALQDASRAALDRDRHSDTVGPEPAGCHGGERDSHGVTDARHDSLPTGKPCFAHKRNMVCLDSSESQSNQSVSGVEYIPLSGKKIGSKPLINSAKAALSGMQLAQFERRWKASAVSPHEIPVWAEHLQATTAAYPYDDTNHQRAARLLEQIGEVAA